jgi:hypothetical protein
VPPGALTDLAPAAFRAPGAAPTRGTAIAGNRAIGRRSSGTTAAGALAKSSRSTAPIGAIVYGTVMAKMPMIAIHSRCRRVPRLDSPNEPVPPKPCGPA